MPDLTIHPHWCPVPHFGPVRLEQGVVDVWRVDLATVGAEAMQLLSAAERGRAAGMVDVGRRALWMRARGVLRALLGAYLERPPDQLEFVLGPHGKPALSAEMPLPPRPIHRRQADPPSPADPLGQPSPSNPNPAPNLSFNLSHSAKTALYAFTVATPVGIDLEVARERRADEAAIARRVFGPEQAKRLQALPRSSRAREFLRLWVVHEAALKCHGQGLMSTAEALTVPLTTGGRSMSGDLWIAELHLGPGVAAALAVQSGPRELCFWEYAAADLPPRAG
jgi:4'-phosphopantetheinyl transferase